MPTYLKVYTLLLYAAQAWMHHTNNTLESLLGVCGLSHVTSHDHIIS